MRKQLEALRARKAELEREIHQRLKGGKEEDARPLIDEKMDLEDAISSLETYDRSHGEKLASDDFEATDVGVAAQLFSGSNGLARRELEEEHEIQRTNRRITGDYGSGDHFRDQSTGRSLRSLKHGDTFTGPQGVRVGESLKALLTGNFDNLSEPERRAVMGTPDSKGGFLLNPQLSSSVVDLARSASVALRSGAQVVPMETGQLDLVKITGDPLASWRGEGQAITSSDITVGRISLKAKVLACLVPISLELVEDAQNSGEMIEQVIRAALGASLDRAILNGAGSASEPLGILNDSDVNTVTSVGTPTNWSHASSAVGKILQANYPGELDGLSWISHPRDQETLDGLTASDNQPLMAPSWPAATRKYATTSLPTDGGAGSNESSQIIGDMSQVVLGLRFSGVRIETFRTGNDGTDNALTEMKAWVRAYLRADVGILQPGWLTAISGVTV